MLRHPFLSICHVYAQYEGESRNNKLDSGLRRIGEKGIGGQVGNLPLQDFRDLDFGVWNLMPHHRIE
jgi:hypothetical protein